MMFRVGVPKLPRRGPEDRGTRMVRTVFIVLGVLFAVAVIVAIVLDARGLSVRRVAPSHSLADDLHGLLTDAASEPYLDPGGLFSFPPPPGWSVVPRSEASGYNALFRGPRGTEIAVTATEVDYTEMDELRARVENIQARYGLDMHVEDTEFLGRPALKRTVNLFYQQVVVIDFMDPPVAHSLQVSMPRELVDAYEEALLNYLQHYRPLQP